MNNNLIYDVESKPKFNKLIVFAFQQVLAIMAATIAVPTIIGLPTQIPAAILGAGLGTIVYLLFTKFKSPVFLGSSFAFLGALGNALLFGYCGIIIGGILAGLVYVIIAIVIKFAGTKWVSKLMPPVIIGPTVAIIGLSLAGSAMGDIVKASGSVITGQVLVETAPGSGLFHYVTQTSTGMSYNLVALLCGLVTFITVVLCSCQNKFKSMKLIPFIIGIGAGYALASFFSIFGYACNVEYLKIVNWKPLVENFVINGEFTGITAFLNYPDFALIEAIRELSSGNVNAAVSAATKGAAQVINGAGVASVALAFIPVALVVFAEHIADHKNLGTIIGRDLVEGEPGLSRTLLGDGVGSMVGTVFGICPNTTYGESVGCVAITKNASIRTIFTAAIMCIVLSFLSPIMALLETIPNCVMGGVCLTLYGFIAVSGLKMFKDIDLGDNKNLYVVSVILIAGIGGLSIKIPYALNGNGTVAKYIEITSIATALLLGIVTYAVINKLEKGKKTESLVTEAVPEENPVEKTDEEFEVQEEEQQTVETKDEE